MRALYDEDRAGDGYISNLSELMSRAFTPSSLTFRQRGILVTAAASALGDSYCSLAWAASWARRRTPLSPRQF